MRFAPTGEATAAWLAEPRNLDKTRGRCMEKVYEQAQTLRFKGEPLWVWHEVELSSISPRP